MLALSFLLLIGLTLVVEGFDQHIPKGYIYFAMGFSVLVEFLNLRVRKPKTVPVNLHERYTARRTGRGQPVRFARSKKAGLAKTKSTELDSV